MSVSGAEHAKIDAAIRSVRPPVSNPLRDYYRCPAGHGQIALNGTLSGPARYFRFGDAVCFGRCVGSPMSNPAAPTLHDALAGVTTTSETTYLPFDLNEVLDNLRCERYTANGDDRYLESMLTKIYYLLRPTIPFGLRGFLKKTHLMTRKDPAFPRW